MQIPRYFRLRPSTWILIGLCALVAGLAITFLSFYIHSYRLVDSHLKTRKWAIPSTVYASAPVLQPGMTVSRAKLASYMEDLGYFRRSSTATTTKEGEYLVTADSMVFKKRRLFLTKSDYSPVKIDFKSDRITKLTNLTTGNALNSYELEPMVIKNLFGDELEKRQLVFYEDIPADLVHAVVAIEDRRFYEHHGVDFHAIARATWANLHGKKVLQGASTITQQLVKNFYLTPEKSFKRKITEAMMSLILERRLSKSEILELYMNEIYLGQNGSTSIHGVGEASKFYFGKDVQHLTLPECALLAGLIQAPGVYNPFRHAEQAIARRTIALAAMRDAGYIKADQYREANDAALRLYRNQGEEKSIAPYFGDVVKTRLLERYKGDTIYTNNLHIFTTIDLDLQQDAEKALAEGLQEIDKQRFPEIHKNAQGCLIAIEPSTGYIRAFVGGRSYSKSQFDRISQATRQPGSVFKPIVYATAFEKTYPQLNAKAASRNSEIFTPATLVRDEPWILKYWNGTWEPKNYDMKYHGVVTLRTALTYSMNVATARLAIAVGLKDIAEMGKRVGFGNVPTLPAISLGAFGASPWDVAHAYAVIASGGLERELTPVQEVTDSQGRVLQKASVSTKRLMHEQTAYLITDMMRSVVTHGTAARLTEMGVTRPVAGKTGTTDDYRDAWFAGFTPQLLCVVWVGYDDNDSLQMNGAEAALPIWARFMESALKTIPEKNFVPPSGLVIRKIDPTTGQLATENCPSVISEIFITGTEPKTYCQAHTYSDFATNRAPDQLSALNVNTRRYDTKVTVKHPAKKSSFWKKFKKLKFW